MSIETLASAPPGTEAAAPPQIVARDLVKTYRLGGSTIAALQGISVEVARGEYLAVTGASGSGKSTFMNLVGALDTPTSGSLNIEGRELGGLGSLPLLYSRHGHKGARDKAKACLAKVGLAHREGHQPPELSGGQQQRVAIARALINDPHIILADEPTGALDSHTTAEIIQLFEELNATGITVIIVTHEPDIAKRARRRLTFRDGEIVSDVS